MRERLPLVAAIIAVALFCLARPVVAQESADDGAPVEVIATEEAVSEGAEDEAEEPAVEETAELVAEEEVVEETPAPIVEEAAVDVAEEVAVVEVAQVPVAPPPSAPAATAENRYLFSVRPEYISVSDEIASAGGALEGGLLFGYGLLLTAAYGEAAPGQTLTLPGVAARNGYTFEGWYSAPAQGVKVGDAGADFDVDGHATVYARWQSILHMDVGDSIINGIVMTLVKAGTFTMGSPEGEPERFSDEKQRQVTLTKDFWISKYPVTNRQYAAVFPSKSFDPAFEDHPVIDVTWQEASDFAAAVGVGGLTGMLPTEAQWEYAARGGHLNVGAGASYSVYSGGDVLGEVGWYGDNSLGSTRTVTCFGFDFFAVAITHNTIRDDDENPK